MDLSSRDGTLWDCFWSQGDEMFKTGFGENLWGLVGQG